MTIGVMGGHLRHIRDLFHDGTSVGLGDGQLLARYAATRDEAAFEALVARHGPMVLATCRAVLRRDADVEDAFQATFLVLARRASTVRAGDALGGWLHRVAYRMAIEAGAASRRRRRREAEASAMRSSQPAADPLDPEVAALVHEELDRLPDRERLAVVLCDLEGLTYEQAARHLQWTEPTLRHRLVRGRSRLRDRLTRRGVTAGAVGMVLAASTAGARAAVPASLAHAAVSAAGGTAPAAVAALSSALIRSLIIARLKLAAAGLLAAASLGLMAAGAGRTGEPAPSPPSPATAPIPSAVAAPQQQEESRPLAEIRGRVVGPDEKPIPGASLRIAYVEPLSPIEATAGPDGRFLLRLPRSVRGAPTVLNGQDEFPWLVATAPGFGPAWVRGILRPTGPGERTIRLDPDGPPLEGRVVDLEGRPVAGVGVRVVRVLVPASGDQAGWLATARARGTLVVRRDLEELPLVAPGVTTDREGRFRLSGIGRDRIARLALSGPTIASAEVLAMNGDGAELRTRDAADGPGKSLLIYPRRFECPAAPTKPIEGVVRDRDSGRPIAGLTLHAAAIDDPRALAPTSGVEAVTDDQGRYRLIGLPKASAYHLAVEQAPGQPYLRTSFRVKDDAPALAPVRFDVALKRGVLIRGRVTDRATGRPAPGYIQAYVPRDNPAIAEYPGFAGYNNLATVMIGEDGRYEAVGLPGRNVIACRSEMKRFRGPVGAETIPGYEPRRMALDTLPLNCYINNYHLLAAVDVKPGAESATLDLQLDLGRTLTIRVEDPEGRPIDGTRAKGLTDLFPDALEYDQPSPTIEVHSLDPSRPRRVLITHAARKLIGAAYLKGDEPGPMTIRLQPWGTITGRIVDDEGQPRRDLMLSNLGGTYPTPPADRGILRGDVWTNPAGRFRADRIVPGLKYDAAANLAVRGSQFQVEAFRDVVVAPGEVKDLGDRKLAPPRRGD